MHLLEELGSHGPIVAALLVVMATFLALRVLRSGPAGRKGSGGQAAGKRSSAACPAAAAATAAKAGSAAAAPAPARYLPFSANLSAEDVLVVDCTHPACRTLTHHKGHCNPPLAVVPGADTSTALVLNALRAQPQQAAALEAWLGRPAHVSCNHFDADAVLSMWCVLNPEDALRHEAGEQLLASHLLGAWAGRAVCAAVHDSAPWLRARLHAAPPPLLAPSLGLATVRAPCLLPLPRPRRSAAQRGAHW